MSISAILCKC